MKIQNSRLGGFRHSERDVNKLIEEKAYRQFYMHGLAIAWLDVHDVGRYDDDRSRLVWDDHHC